jgi:hypothetical protein
MMEGVQESPSQEYGVCSMEYGVWSMEYGVWSMEYGVWSMANATLRYQEEERRKKNLEPELVSSNYLKPLT